VSFRRTYRRRATVGISLERSAASRLARRDRRGATPGRIHDDDITCYASVGLADTEVLLARHVLTAAVSAR
jgi:ornithine cyclodeaminase/alanine dehydrogenase-like protein (mu-crystallin family)